MPLLPKYLKLVEDLLSAQKTNFSSAQERIAYERGYLTGLLARLAQDDSNVAHHILRSIKKSGGNK